MQLRAGQLQVRYENGFLRYVCIEGKEILRMIYFAVRDRDWNTIPGKIENEEIRQTENTFSISYEFNVKEGEIHMQWKVCIDGSPDNSIIFDIQGLVLNNFHKNRLGFCVLHPVEGVTGKPCLIEHPDGNITQSFFPTFISPYQPFQNVHAMQWQPGKKGTFRLNFEGDIFETEDHRNWTDTSYKTYCTPLDLPFPVEVKAGDIIHQKCTFQVVDFPANSATSITEGPASIQLTNQKTNFPEIGVGINPEGVSLQTEEIQLIQSAGFSHLRADIFVNQSNWQQALNKALEQSESLQIPLELALFFGEHPDSEVLQFLSYLYNCGPSVKNILVFNAKTRLSSTALLKKVVPAIRYGLPGCRIGGGTDANFAEVNRNILDYTLIDFIAYSVNPQVHASDSLTLIENMPAQADTVESAKKLSSGKRVHISPATLKPRFNAVATSGTRQVIPPADDRQASSFIAGWTLGSLKYVSEAGAASITYYETTGARGICSASTVYPVGKLLSFILKTKPHTVQLTNSSQPLQITSLLLVCNKKTYLILANHTTIWQSVLVDKRINILKLGKILANQPDKAEVLPDKDSSIDLGPFAISILEVSIKTSET